MKDYGLVNIVVDLANQMPENPNFYSLYYYVSRHGKLWTPAPLPTDIKLGKQNRCFENARKLAEQKNLRYVEGYGFTSHNKFLPLLHGWCLNDKDEVVDPTWKDGVAYLGVVFDLNFVKEQLSGSKCLSVLDNYHKGFPLLKKTA